VEGHQKALANRCSVKSECVWLAAFIESITKRVALNQRGILLTEQDISCVFLSSKC
jgi:hypothetical protein